MKIGIVAFIIPFVFVYGTSILMIGDTLEIITATITALIGVFALATSVEGWFWGSQPMIMTRIILLIASVTLIFPGLMSDIIGISLIVIALGIELYVRFKVEKQQLQG